ncbi:hypothetical protein [Metabacillus sp. RGM 3146]|uniref:hypothetical protein n=1 Tax=Metabacillus sp. RGM 3146 TaxID=3401092 RepID=UPI003B9C79DF
MKWAKRAVLTGIGCLLLYNGYVEHVIKASVIPSQLQKEVLADKAVSREEALLLVAEKLKNEGKDGVGVSFQAQVKEKYVCIAKWLESSDETKSADDDKAIFSVNRFSGTVELIH